MYFAAATISEVLRNPIIFNFPGPLKLNSVQLMLSDTPSCSASEKLHRFLLQRP